LKITPLDIRRKEFKRSVRGYSDEEVDLFLDAVADEFERLFQENIEFQDRAHALEEQLAGHAHVRDALEKTIVAAQVQSQEIRSNAEKEGESILQEAETKAKGIVSELYAQTQKEQQTLIQLKLLEEEFRFKFRSLLEGHLKLLDEGSIALALTDAETTATEAPATEKAADVIAEVPVIEEPPQFEVGGRDDSPTLETEESMTVIAAVEPQAVKEAIAPDLDESTEEATVETSQLASENAVPENGEEGDAAEGTAEEESVGQGVFFGRQEEDEYDPFPGVGPEKPAKARDFEW
jgi:cell division initiation protein